MKTSHLLAVVSALFIAACGGGTVRPTLTPLEIQALQQHEYETDKEVAFSSVVSVFQDLGYIVKSADKDTGFITADSPTKDTTGFISLLNGNKLNSQTSATAFVETVTPGRTRIRLNFLTSNSESTWYGRDSKHDIPILDGRVYQAAFERIEEAIFIRAGTAADKIAAQ